MLAEMVNVRQRPEEGYRRWFSDDEFDLIVWYTHDRELLGFQLCYDKRGTERAFTWKTDGSFIHSRVDAGDTILSGMKRTAVLVADGTPQSEIVASTFRAAARDIEPAIAEMVYERLLKYPEA